MSGEMATVCGSAAANRGVTAVERGTGQSRISGVSTIRVLPEYTEIVTENEGNYILSVSPDSLTILSKGFNMRSRTPNKPVATFLYFPEDDRATVFLEERGSQWTIVINEGSSILKRVKNGA